jgi:hypothetical protein
LNTFFEIHRAARTAKDASFDIDQNF